MIDAVKISKALGDPIRYRIMMLLARSYQACCPQPGNEGSRPGLCNCEIMTEMRMIQSRVSYHMKELLEAGLVWEEQSGKWKYYFINEETLRQYTLLLRQDCDI